MRSVLLIISVPDRTKSRTSGCRSHGPIVHAPPSRSLADATLPGGQREDGDEQHAGGNGRAFEIGDLARARRKRFRGHVVTREAAHAAAHEVEQRHPVPSARAARRRSRAPRARPRTKSRRRANPAPVPAPNAPGASARCGRRARRTRTRPGPAPPRRRNTPAPGCRDTASRRTPPPRRRRHWPA